MAVGDPDLPRLGALQQGNRQRAFALVGVLTRDHVGHKPTVGIVNHDRLPRQGRPTMPAQHPQALFAPGQMIAVEHAKLIAGQTRLNVHVRHHRRKPLGRALHQSLQNARLGVVDLVIQRRQRYRQIVHLSRRRMQRRA
jgi:hypothetical protein